MGNITSCYKINDDFINIDDEKLHKKDKKDKKKNNFKTSVGPPIIVEHIAADEPLVQDNHLVLLQHLD